MPDFSWDPSLYSSLKDLQHNSSLCASFSSSRSLPSSQETASLPRNRTRNSRLISCPLPCLQLSLHHHGPFQLHLALCSLSVPSNTSELEIFNHSNALRLHSSCLLTVSLSPLLHSWALPGPRPILLFLTSCPDAAFNFLPRLAKGAREAGRQSADFLPYPHAPASCIEV